MPTKPPSAGPPQARDVGVLAAQKKPRRLPAGQVRDLRQRAGRRRRAASELAAALMRLQGGTTASRSITFASLKCGISQKGGFACAFMDGPSVGMKQARGRTTVDRRRKMTDGVTSAGSAPPPA